MGHQGGLAWVRGSLSLAARLQPRLESSRPPLHACQTLDAKVGLAACWVLLEWISRWSCLLPGVKCKPLWCSAPWCGGGCHEGPMSDRPTCQQHQSVRLLVLGYRLVDCGADVGIGKTHVRMCVGHQKASCVAVWIQFPLWTGPFSLFLCLIQWPATFLHVQKKLLEKYLNATNVCIAKSNSLDYLVQPSLPLHEFYIFTHTRNFSFLFI
jgi:hypothetical protein